MKHFRTAVNQVRNNSMQGAAAGTPGTLPTNWSLISIGTLTREVVGIGTSAGIDYIDIKLSGTTSTVFLSLLIDTVGTIPAVNGQTWTGSVYLAMTAGAKTNISGLTFNAANYAAGSSFIGPFLSTAVLTPLSATLTRYTASALINNATTVSVNPYLQFTWSSGVAIDITLRIGWPQLEVGGSVTSPIRTVSGSATRLREPIQITKKDDYAFIR